MPPKPPRLKTVFTSRELLFPEGVLTIDGNTKITCEDGSPTAPVANAFSLPHISTCPGATEACMKACYVHGLKAAAEPTYAAYVRNERVLHRILASPRALDRAIMFGLKLEDLRLTRFRWHVSGDVFSPRYASWIAEVCKAAPKIRFWIYTRSFDSRILDHLIDTPNLTVNISADQDNLPEAEEVARTRGLTLCQYVESPDEPISLLAGVIFPGYDLRGRDLDEPTEHSWWVGLMKQDRRKICTADFFGQRPEHRCGPCRKCL